MNMKTVELADIQEARRVLSHYLEPTPLLANPWLSELYGCKIYLKMENFQPIGSFKIRGATYKVACLSPEEKAKGVIAASAGNHAQGVAWGSLKLGVSSLIVMPKSAPIVKIQNTKALRAQVHLEGMSYDEAFSAAKRISEETGRVYVHAFEDPHVIAGQGTVGLEIMEQLPDVDVIVSSIGGGGLAAGISISAKALRPQTQIYGCQAEGAPSMAQSLKKGKAVTLDQVETFADGIKVGVASEPMRVILQKHLEGVLTADDEAMAASILMLLEKGKTLSEGAGALPLAVLDQIRPKIQGKKVVLVISGGNIDVNVLSRIIDRGLTRAGRRLRVNVLISDRPGSLAQLTSLLARQGANVLQTIHDRNEPSTRIDQTEVELTLETRGPDHSEQVIEALRSQVLKIVVAH